MPATPSIRQLMQQTSHSFTPSERKLFNLLSGSNPMLALGPIHQLADKAEISPPTVVRFAVKLGFAGYADFQRAWVAELTSMFSSPLTQLDQKQHGTNQPFGQAVGAMVSKATENLPALAPTLALLSDEKRRIYLRGGRFSQLLVHYLYAHLHQLRGNLEVLEYGQERDLEATLDMHKRDVLLLFDFRRYQDDTLRFVRQASKSGITIILFTDPWLSPAASYAKHIFISEVAAPSAYDTLVPAMAQVEYLVKCLLEQGGEAIVERLRRLEASRSAISPDPQQPHLDHSPLLNPHLNKDTP